MTVETTLTRAHVSDRTRSRLATVREVTGASWQILISAGGVLCVTLSLPCAAIASQKPSVERNADGQVTVRAVRLDQLLVVDGVLDEPLYSLLPPAAGFIQQDPHQGEPATEDTEMWVLFDDDNIYVSARCWDSRPELIVANEMRRDNGGLYDNDNFAVIFDTFHDRRNAFIFHINPLGGLLDAQLFDENLFNRDWNTVWNAKTSRFDRGWAAEIVIPFKSLRYKGGGPQVWGINARRIVRSKNEFTHITLIPASYGTQGILKVSSAATLVGLETPERSQNLEIKPYVRGDLTTNLEADPPVRDEVDVDVGLDLKYGVTRGMTFDFTYNTDFAQVEVDERGRGPRPRESRAHVGSGGDDGTARFLGRDSRAHRVLLLVPRPLPRAGEAGGDLP